MSRADVDDSPEVLRFSSSSLSPCPAPLRTSLHLSRRRRARRHRTATDALYGELVELARRCCCHEPEERLAAAELHTHVPPTEQLSALIADIACRPWLGVCDGVPQ